jgi:UDP-N-acetylglucosamine acyltransferase
VNIHPTAIVDGSAELADDVEVGPFAIIEADVQIDSGSKIGPRATLSSGARLGKNVQVFNGAVIGMIPQDLKFKGESSTAVVGDGTIVREFVTIHRGTVDSGTTVVGNNCFLMAYSHVAHDCVLGNNVILANVVTLAGHVVLQDYVIIGGIVPIHQFVRIGRHAFIAGGTRVPKDVPPFVLAAYEPLRYAGLNAVGLKRRDFNAERIALIKNAYRLIYLSELNISQGIERVRNEMEINEDLQHIIDFIEASERGII